MKATTVYALLKKQISSVASGISDIEAEGSNLIFTLNDGTTITVDIPAPPGADVTDIEIDANNHLIFTFSDGDVKDAGEIPLDPRMDNIVPEEFSSSKSYVKGKMVMHDNKMYICNSLTPIGGTWDVISGAFDEVDISSAISTKISNVVPSGTSGGVEPSSDAGKVMTWGEYGGWEVQEIPNNIADDYDSTLVYNTGDCCMFKGIFYQCNTDSTTGTWDAQYWDPTTVFQSVSDGKELIADAITDKGVPTSATDTFQDMANNIAQISGGSEVKVIPLSVYVNEGDQTYTRTVSDGIYLIGYLTANNQTGSIAISGTYTRLYNKYAQQIVKVEGEATITYTLTADTGYPNAHVFAYICQIEGATTFTDYYGQQSYDSGELYDFSNLGSGKYIVIASGTSIYSGTSTAYVTYPWHPTSGRVAELGDVSSYYNDYGYKALTIVVREAPSASHLSSSIYAYGQYGGRGSIQIIEVS